MPAWQLGPSRLPDYFQLRCWSRAHRVSARFSVFLDSSPTLNPFHSYRSGSHGTGVLTRLESVEPVDSCVSRVLAGAHLPDAAHLLRITNAPRYTIQRFCTPVPNPRGRLYSVAFTGCPTIFAFAHSHAYRPCEWSRIQIVRVRRLLFAGCERDAAETRIVYGERIVPRTTKA